MKKLSPKIKTAIKLIIGLGALVLISRSGHLNWKVLGSLFSQPDTLVVLLSLSAFNLFSQALRWWLILRRNIPSVSLASAVQIQLIGSFFNFVFPSAIGGDLIRGYYIAQHQRELRMRAVFTVILDRMIGLYSLVALSAFFLLFSLDSQNTETFISLRFSVWTLFFGCTIFFALVASGQLLRLMKPLHFFKPSQYLIKIHDQLRAFVLDGKLFSSTFIVGVIGQFTAVVFFYWIAQHTNLTTATFPQLLSVVPLGFLAMSIPISPAGIGVGQVAYLFLIKQIVGETSDFGPTAISAFQLAILVWSLLGGWFYLTLKKPEPMEDLNG